MKRQNAIPVLFLLLNLLPPAAALILPALGLELKLVFPEAILILHAALATILVIADVRMNREEKSSTLLRLPLPAAAACCGLYLLLEISRSPWAGLPALVIFGCGLILCRRLSGGVHIMPLKLLLHGVPGAVLALFALITAIFSGFGAVYTYPESVSPDGALIASASIIDQGALGGDTVIEIYPSHGLDLGLVKIRRKPVETHYGDWQQPDQFSMEWFDDHTLLVNGTEYTIGP